MSGPAERSLSLSVCAAFLIFVVIALLTGGSIGFAVVGGLICAAVSAAIGFTINRVKTSRSR